MSNRLLLLLLSCICISPAVFAEVDTMKNLFSFQQKMAKNGQASAMMKLGKMYERGEGVKQDNNKALEMFQKANVAGHPKAKKAIQRIQLGKNRSNKDKNKISKQKQLKRALATEKSRKRQKAKIAKERAAKIKDAKEKDAKEKAVKLRARKVKDAKERAVKLRAQKAKTAKERAVKLRAQKAKIAKERAVKLRTQKAKIAKERAAEIKDEKAKNAEEEFKSNPCKGKAARFLSTCR